MEENPTNTQSSPNNTKKTNPAIFGIIAIAVLILVAGVALMKNSNTQPQNGSLNQSAGVPTTGTEPKQIADKSVGENENSNPLTPDSESTVKVIEVEGGSFYFKPDVITVKKGEKVKIVLNSVDMMHDFVIDELSVKTEIARAGNTVEVVFTATESGEFEFYCSVGNHKAMGMVGTLVVN